MDRQQRGPRFGVGPVYIILVVLLTIFALALGRLDVFSAGIIPTLALPLQILGGVSVAIGVLLWMPAATTLRMRRVSGQSGLITTGVFAWVRNPLYSGYMFIFSGILCFEKNLWLLVFPPLFWLLMSVLVRREEAGLEKEFGEEYLEYKAGVNRCIPWFPKKQFGNSADAGR